MTGRPATKWGQCENPDCAGEYTLRMDGKVRRHPAPGFTYANSREVCKGSERYPVRVLVGRPAARNAKD